MCAHDMSRHIFEMKGEMGKCSNMYVAAFSRDNMVY